MIQRNGLPVLFFVEFDVVVDCDTVHSTDTHLFIMALSTSSAASSSV